MREDEQLKKLEDEIKSLRTHNETLAHTLREAKEQLIALKGEVENLSKPPSSFAIILSNNRDGSVDILNSGRKLRVTVSPEVDKRELLIGREVILNDALNVVDVLSYEMVGEVVTLKEVLTDQSRAVVIGRTDEEKIARLAQPLIDENLRAGDSLMLDTKNNVLFEKIPKSDIEELVLEEVPDVDYSDIGGLGQQIEQIRDAVEMPYLHKELYAEHKLKAPKGILLYGPPGCGKTLIAKAVANSLAKKVSEKTGQVETKSFFLNIKGPELLNKYVGETERHIRQIFQRAREKANSGTPVIVFFDEMDSLFRTRGSGVSSDVENTIVPQLLSEIDGVEALENVIVIGASNREDMIDPAILRPGRLDVKIKIERPDIQAAREILAKYLTSDLPIHPEDLKEYENDSETAINQMIDVAVNRMYAQSDENRFIEVTYANGDREVLYFKDFNSGASLENIVSRAKKDAIKDFLATGVKGISVSHLVNACYEEFRANEDLPNSTNPDDWARISGKKGERIVFLRTLIQSKQGEEPGRSIETVSHTGQYL